MGAGRALLRPLEALLLRATAALARPRSPPAGSPADVTSILILRVDERVGNVLLTTPLLAPLRARYPEARIDLLVARSKAALVDGLARVIPFEKRDFFVRPWRAWALLWRLRRSTYDVVIDASHWHQFSVSSALLLAWTSAKIRIAHRRGAIERCATDLIPAPAGPELEIRTKLRLLEPLGVSVQASPMSTALGRDPAAAAKIERWLGEASLGRFVVLAPGGRKEEHRVASEVFAAIGEAAKARGAGLVVLWGPGEEDLAAPLARELGASLAPPTDLEEMAALIRRSAAVVVNDTGPMHLAVALGAPTIALFRQPAEWRWGHPEPPHAVIAAAGKSPEAIVAEAAAALVRILG